jgi:hypothetical protein
MKGISSYAVTIQESGIHVLVDKMIKLKSKNKINGEV